MQHFLNLLSGNVPGGVYLYLIILAALFFIFYYFYRTSELFTRRLFLRWMLGGWLLLTVIYAYIWWRNFPEEYFLKRYTLEVTAADPEARVWAYFIRDELSERTKPYVNRWQYFFPQRWLYYANVDCNNDSLQCQHVWAAIPVTRVLTIKVLPLTAGQWQCVVSLKEKGKAVTEKKQFVFTSAQLDGLLEQIMQWIGKRFPFQHSSLPLLTYPQQILARDAFYRGEYEKSYRMFQQAFQNTVGDSLSNPWYLFSKIRYALVLRQREGWVNPLNKEERPWQRLNRQARHHLLRLLKQQPSLMEHPWVNMMIGESFLLEENFKDAEVFLENAYILNPFDVDILENLSHLHASRLANLHLGNKLQVWQKILLYHPMYESLLVQYVEALLNIHPVQGDPPAIARQVMMRYLQLNPQSPTIWNLLGKYYLLTRRYPEALHVFGRADSLNPRNSITKYNLGIAFYNLKNYNKAKQYFKEAIAIDDFLDAHLYLGQIYREEGNCEAALKEFRYRVKHKRGPEDAYALEAMKGIRDCLKKLGQPIPEKGR